MSAQRTFVSANEALGKVVAQITDQWEVLAPAHMTWRPGQTVRELVNYHAYDDACVPDVLAGETKEEWSGKHQGDLLGEDPLGSYARYNEAAKNAVRGFADLDRQVHLSYGDFPAEEYLQHITLFRGLRTYDFARLIGVDPAIPDDVVRWLWDYVNEQEAMLREIQVIGPRLPVPDDAPLLDRVLAFTGRDPSVSP